MEIRGAMTKHIKVFALLLLLIPCSFTVSQQKKAGKNEKPGMPTFRVPVNVITIHATVTDNQGNPVTDLKQSDFKIYEDGKLQEINTFAQESYIPAQEPAEDLKNAKTSGTIAPRSSAPPKSALQSPAFLISATPRMISLVIDDMTMGSIENFPRMIEAIREYIKNDVGPLDQVAILSGSTKAQLSFTDDKQLLQERAASLMEKINLLAPARECPDITDQQAYRIAFLDANDKMELMKAMVNAFECMNLREYSDDLQTRLDSLGVINGELSRAQLERVDTIITSGEQEELAHFLRDIQTALTQASNTATMKANQYQNRVQILLDTLRRHIRALRHFDAEKRLVFFSNGFLSQSTGFAPYQLQEIIDLALNSSVILNCVNIRGLETGMETTDKFSSEGKLAKKIMTAINAMPATSSEKETLLKDLPVKYVPLSNPVQERLDDSIAKEEPLKQLASDTGGQYFHNNNNLYKGIRQIIRSQSHYYVLTYATPSKKPNGAYHKIKLEVSHPGVEISYRKGFFSPKEEMTFEKRKKEDILDALRAPGNLNEIPVSLSYNCHLKETANYGVSFLTSIDIDRLRFLDEDARRKNLISLILVAYDESDQYIAGVEKIIDFKLLENSYTDLRQRGLSSRVELKLPLGRYKIKAVVRESVQGKMGSLTKAIEVP
jgi:VWFA-related protein